MTTSSNEPRSPAESSRIGAYRQQFLGESMMYCEGVRVKRNVTHRLCTHRLHALKMTGDAARYSHSVWPRDPPHPRGAEDQPGRGGRAMWAAPDVLQRD